MRQSNEPKRITRSQITGQQGVNFVEQIVLEMGFAWHPANASLDAGIDGTIEIIDPETGKATNYIIQVQVKATSSDKDINGLVHYCKARDIDYWMNGNTPVILIKVISYKRKAYWVDIKQYFADPKRRKQANIVFNKVKNRFDSSATLALMKLAVHKNIGPYMPAIGHKEILHTNLIEIKKLPDFIYCASTDYREPQEIFDWANDNKIDLPKGWLLTEKMIRSFHDLREHPWTKICDRGSVEQFDVGEWSDSDDPDIQREFVRLMNQALQHDMHTIHLWYSSKEQCFYFPAKRDYSGEYRPSRYCYKSSMQNTSREVVKLMRKLETTEINCIRHSAFKATFLQVNDNWHLAIVPDYIYTTDGKTPYLYGEDLLSGIKRLEHQNAVLNQTIMWQRKLTEGENLFSQKQQANHLITFGEILKVECERGISDKDWLENDVPIEVDEDDGGLF